MKHPSPIEKLHFACSSKLPDSFVLVTDETRCSDDRTLRMEDLRAIRARLENIERALHGGRDHDKERREFIRDTASRYLADGETIHGETDPKLFEDAWRDARALWNAKPEDC